MPSVSVPPQDGDSISVNRPDGTSFTRKVRANGTVDVDDTDLYLFLSTVQGSALASQPDASSKDK